MPRRSAATREWVAPDQHCKPSNELQELIRVAMTELNLSGRAYDRVLKVSRTVADLRSSDEITSEHVSEAIQTFDRTYGPRGTANGRLSEVFEVAQERMILRIRQNQNLLIAKLAD